MARRFIVNKEDIVINKDNIVNIVGDEVRHIHVLRHKVGDEIIVNEYVCKIVDMKKEKVILQALRLSDKLGEPGICVTLYMAMIKGDKMDFVIQKAVELGVKYITPFISKNVVVKLDEKAMEKRKEKYQKIADEACKQCGRTDMVIINEILGFNEMLPHMSDSDINIFAYEKETNSLKTVLTTCSNFNVKNINLIVGPEGGFTEGEADSLRYAQNMEIVSLGDRILRAETAAMNLLSIVMYELNNKT